MPLDTYFRFLLALVFVLGLIGACAWAAKRFGLGNRLPRPRGKVARLGIVEVAPLDARRKLVLVRRDGVEHLLILGPTGETVVEGGIRAAEAASPHPLLPGDAA
jgi:flagellar protein FliO/FliZ